MRYNFDRPDQVPWCPEDTRWCQHQPPMLEPMVEPRQHKREAAVRQPRLIPLNDREFRGCQRMKKQKLNQKTYTPRETEWTHEKTDGNEL